MIRTIPSATVLTATLLAGAVAAQDTGSLDRYQLDFNGLNAPIDAQWLEDDRLVILESAPPAIRVSGWLECSSPTPIDCGTPGGIAAGPDDTLYVTDTARNRVLHLSTDGTTLGTIVPPDGFRAPTGIAMHDGRLYVSDTGNDRIVAIALDGTVHGSIGGRGTEPGRFRRPLGIDIDASGRLVVADADNHRVQVLSLDGRPIAQWGSWGSFPGLFQEPSDVVCLDDRIIVTDRLNHRVQVFSPEGELLHAWGMHAVKPREGEGRIHYPDALTCSPDGTRLAVVESFEDRVQFFGATDPDWMDEETLQRIAQRPTSPARSGIQSHFGPTVDLDDRILVVWEPEARAALIFDHQRATPIRLTSIFSRGDGPGGFGHLADLHWDHTSNRLHLFDRGTAQVHVYGIDLPPADQPRFDPSMARLLTSRTLDPSIPMHRIADAEHDGGDRWFLLDDTDGVIHVLDASMQPVDRWDEHGMQQPVAIVFDATTDRLLALDRDGGRIHRLDASGRPTGMIELPDDVVEPTGLAISSKGDLLVSDGGAHRVHRLSHDGEPLAAWGVKGSNHEEFWKPAGLVVDDRDRVIVLDHGNHRCQMFDLDGTWLMTFGAGRAYTPSNRPPRVPDPE